MTNYAYLMFTRSEHSSELRLAFTSAAIIRGECLHIARSMGEGASEPWFPYTGLHTYCRQGAIVTASPVGPPILKGKLVRRTVHLILLEGKLLVCKKHRE
jgi:hypothetical protein